MDTLVASAVVNTLAALVFVFVGFRFKRHPVAPKARMAAGAFVVWWLGIAGYMLLWIALPKVLVVTGVTSLPVYLMLLHSSMFSLCLALGCLVFYLLFLFSGRRWLWIPVALYYGVLFVTSVVIFTVHQPVDVRMERWWVDLEYRVPLGTAFQVWVAMLILPSTVGAIGYFTLIHRTTDPMMRFRISVVSWGIIVWGLLGALARALEADFLQFLLRTLIGLLVALLVLVAYELPALVKKRRELEGRYTQSGRRSDSLERVRRARSAERQRELQWRMDELL